MLLPASEAVRIQRDDLCKRPGTRYRVNECQLSPLHAIISYVHGNHPVRDSFQAVICKPPSTRVMRLGLEWKQTHMKITRRDSWQLVNTRRDPSLLHTWNETDSWQLVKTILVTQLISLLSVDEHLVNVFLPLTQLAAWVHCPIILA